MSEQPTLFESDDGGPRERISRHVLHAIIDHVADNDDSVHRDEYYAEPDPLDPDATTSQSDTALPLPRGGKGGNHDRALVEWLVAAGVLPQDLLEVALSTVPRPPLHDLSVDAVREWADAIASSMPSAREARKLMRAVERHLVEQAYAEMRAEREAGRLEARQRMLEAKRAGTYWRGRDAQRAATLPMHIEVDPDAWVLFKLRTRRSATTIGVRLGELIRQAVDNQRIDNVSSRRPPPARVARRPGRKARVFARAAVTKAVWSEFGAVALEHSVTSARGVGLLVERDIASIERLDVRPHRHQDRDPDDRSRCK